MSIVPPEPDSNKSAYLQRVRAENGAYRSNPAHMAKMRAIGEVMDHCADCQHGWNFHPGGGPCALAMANFLCECAEFRDDE